MPSELLTALAVQARGEKWRLISKTEICTASCGKTELYINAWKIFRDLKLFRAIVSFTPPDGFW